MKHTIKKILSHIAHNLVPYVFGLFLVYTGLMKVYMMKEFSADTVKIWIVPDTVRYYLPVIVPATELILGLCIFVRSLRKYALVVTCVLFVGFIVFHIWNIQYGIIESCHCLGVSTAFGLDEKGGSKVMILILLGSITTILLWLYEQKKMASTRQLFVTQQETVGVNNEKAGVCEQ